MVKFLNNPANDNNYGEIDLTGAPMPILLMAADPSYHGMMRDHDSRHSWYCRQHGYEWSPVYLDDHTGWARIELVLNALLCEQYSHVFWLCAECFIVDGTADMRNTLPEWAYLAMAIHPIPWADQVFHFQTGIFYARSCPKAIDFFRAVLALKDTEGVYNDQDAMVRLLMEKAEIWQDGFCVLPHRWNWTIGLTDSGEPTVAAFHGRSSADDRQMLMREWAARLPYRE